MIYRQRFTATGWIGATLLVFGPMLAGYIISEYLGSPSYRRPHEIWIAVSASLAPIGALLALVGREYYDAAQEVAKEQHARRNIAAHDAAERKKHGI